MRKRDFDYLFNLIPSGNDTLKNKIINKFGIIRFGNTFEKFGNYNYAILISYQFANQQISQITYNCVRAIMDICIKKQAQNIALNIDYDNIRHYIYFKNLFQETFRGSNVSTTFFFNKIVELKEGEDINKILDLYHKSLLGGHVGSEKMQKTISKFYHWDKMSDDIKKYRV